MKRSKMLEVFEDHKADCPSQSIYIWLDTVDNEFRYLDGYEGNCTRVIDHQVLWCHLDEEDRFESLVEDFHLMVVSPESQHLMVDYHSYNLFTDIIKEHFEGWEVQLLNNEDDYEEEGEY